MRRFLIGASMLACVALIVGACSDDGEDPDGAGASQGDAGAAGSGTSQGSAGGGHGGDGDGADACAADPNSETCREVPWCGPFAITEVCGPTPFPLCPSSLDNFVERTPCDTVTKLEIYDTECGGRVLIRYYEARTESWEFDEDDTLTSVLVEGNSLHTCFEGGRSVSWLYGSDPCKLEPSSKLDACTGQGGAGAGGAGAGGAAGASSVGGAPSGDPADAGGAGGAR